MHFVSVSFTHKNTDISLRERLSFAQPERKREVLRLIGANENVVECMALSTCNRVEIFAVVSALDGVFSHILRSISIITLIPYESLEFRGDFYEDDSAIHHLFSVASSLDSLVIGETQITGQLKADFKFAQLSGNASTHIQQAIGFALKCAAKVRSLADFGRGGVSVASVAVAKAKRILNSLEGVKAVVVGSGEMSRLCAKHLASCGADIFIVARNALTGEQLASEVGAEFLPFSKLGEAVNFAGVLFSATSANEAVITQKMVRQTGKKRLFFDLAIPRDICVESGEVELFWVDDLQDEVASNISLREEQANEAYKIVGQSVVEFNAWKNSFYASPAICALRTHAREVALRELEIAVKKGYIKHCDKEEAARLLHQTFRAFLHTPSVRLKAKNDKQTLEVLQFLFDLNADEE